MSGDDRILQQFRQACAKVTTPVIVAASGGLDSTVLCHVAQQTDTPFLIAHCNFNLRGEESARDEAFVRTLAELYGVAVFVKSFQTGAEAEHSGRSIQETARTLRYRWFAELLETTQAGAVLLGHHADDNHETLIFQFLRGTGLKGLTGMPVHRPGFLRPLLDISRAEIREYALRNGLDWVEDSSNEKSDYTRNFLRNEIIPRLKEVFPGLDHALAGNINRFQNIFRFYESAIQGAISKLIVQDGEIVKVPIRKLLKISGHETILFEIIRHFGFTEKQIGEVMKLTASDSGKLVAGESARIIRHGLWLYIVPSTEHAAMVSIGAGDVHAVFGACSFDIRYIPADRFTLKKEASLAQLDAAKLQFPLLLRPCKTGDYFYPLGMRKKKKVARFFVDQKMPRHQKEQAWILESAGRVVWVSGLRIDDRFKVTNATRDVYLLHMRPIRVTSR